MMQLWPQMRWINPSQSSRSHNVILCIVIDCHSPVFVCAVQVDFAFHVWCHFPERLVGFPARSHYWSESAAYWAYTSKWTNEYSMILPGAAFFHRWVTHSSFLFMLLSVEKDTRTENQPSSKAVERTCLPTLKCWCSVMFSCSPVQWFANLLWWNFADITSTCTQRVSQWCYIH